MKQKLYILSIDGGGLKGLIAIRILRIIEEITGKKIADLFGLFGGTSTGGLIVSALTVKGTDNKSIHDLAYIENIYLDVGQTIFSNGGISLSGNETKHFNDILTAAFGNKKLTDTVKPVFIPTFDLSDNKLVIFKTRSAMQDPSKNLRLFDVCRATSAVPPVFPTYPLKYNHKMLKCVDGGYYMKNPSLGVLAEAWKHKTWYLNERMSEEDIVMISISTGTATGSNRNWSRDISDILHSQTHAKSYIREQQLLLDLKKINYLRVDMDIGFGSFSFMKLMEIGEKLDLLMNDKKFKAEILHLFP